LLYNAIKEVQENLEGWELNETHQLLVYADDVDVLVKNINTMKKNAEPLLDTNKEIGLEANIEKTKYMLIITRMRTKL
jgi:uncharacterized protein YabE (DUF348 family)